MDQSERARLRALRKRADGSWRLLTADDVDSDKDIAENGCTFVADLGATDVRHRRCWSIVGPLNIVAMPHEIGALIVGAVNALPALLDDSERLDAVTRERDEARAETADLRATVDTMQVQLDAHREWLATAQATGDEARAEVERLREQARVWRTLAHDGSIASRDLGAIGATESALALAACARRASQHAAQGAAAEREACATICDAAEVERDACCDDRSRSLHAGRMHGADECARAIRARGTGGAP